MFSCLKVVNSSASLSKSLRSEALLSPFSVLIATVVGLLLLSRFAHSPRNTRPKFPSPIRRLLHMFLDDIFLTPLNCGVYVRGQERRAVGQI